MYFLSRWRTRRAATRVAQASAVFDRWADEGKGEGMERSHGPVARRVFETLHMPADGRYLDIGCGNGYTVRWAAARLPGGTAVGLDVSPHMVARARALSTEYPNVRFIEGPFPSAELVDADFDAVFSMEVFYYLPNLPGALEAVRRILKPGGVFACVVDYYRENAASHGWPGYVGATMTLLSRRQWGSLFRRSGFVNVRQDQLTVPRDEAREEWHATVGSLVTVGEVAR